MRFSVSILGTEIFALSLGAEVYGDEPEPWNGATHTGGSFERDTGPLRANREEPYYEEDRFGFHDNHHPA